VGGRNLLLFLALLVLAGAAGAALVFEELARRRASPHGEEFQRLLGGVGFGPAMDLSGCAFGFDPRLDGSCSEDRGSIPGGACFCPRHAGSLFVYPPLQRDRLSIVEGGGDAPPP
jgi:hypothetical protein